MGLWFIPAIIGAGYAVKKICEAVSDGSSPSTSSSLGSKISSEQSRRSDIRRKALEAVVVKQQEKTLSGIKDIAERDSIEIGQIDVEKNFFGASVDFRGISSVVSSIKMHTAEKVTPLGLGFAIARHHGFMRSLFAENMHFDSTEMSIEDILQVADSRFGPMAGLDSQDVYHKKDDPFFNRLRAISG